MEENTRKGGIRRTKKEVAGCVQALVIKKLVKFKDGQKRDMFYFLLIHVCYEEKFGHDVNKPIYDLPPK